MILYINTSGKHCEVVLFDKKEVLTELIIKEPMQHSVQLHDLIASSFEKTGRAIGELSAIAVLNGPGSYTGLRVGLAAAKGFCYALDIPLILLNKLSLLCSYYASLSKSPIAVGAIQFARAEEYFFAVQTDEELNKFPPAVRSLETLQTILTAHPSMVLVSDIEENLVDLDVPIVKVIVPKQYISKIVNKRLITNEVDDLFSSEPFYLKKVHANKPKKRF